MPALNPDTAEVLRLAVWADFELAVAFFVVSPLVLIGMGLWSSLASGRQSDEVLRLMSGYWQCSSLLLITVLLNVGGVQVGAVAGLAAQAMIAVSLWFWEDLNEAVAVRDGAVAALFRAWRLVASAVAVFGVAAQLPFQYCAAATSLAADAGCAAWIEAPLAFADLLPGLGLELGAELGAQLGLAGLAVYAVYLSYFALFILPSVGRRGLALRPGFTWLAPLEWLGLVSPPRE